MGEHFDANSVATGPPKSHPLPYVALALTFFVPFFISFINPIIKWGEAFFSAIALLSPIAGVLTAIIALCLGKKRIGTAGKIISIIVIAVPLCAIAGILALLFALTNGTFVLHM